MKRAAMATSLLVLTVALTPAASFARKTQISYMCWIADADGTKVNQKIIDAFQKANPLIEVKLIGVYWPGETGYMSKFLTMTVGNVAPDVVAMPFHLFPAVVESNVITDLSPYVARTKDMNLKDWFDVGISSSRWKGRLFGLPTYGSTWWVHYNRRLFTEAGLVEPEQLYEDGQWTIDAMSQAAQKTTRWTAEGKMDRIGILTTSDVIGLNSWIRGFGGEFYDEDKNLCTVDKEPTVKAFSYIYDLIFAKKAMTLAATPPYNTDHGGFAKQGRFAMMAWWDSMAGQIRGMKANWPLNTVPFPKGPARSNNINAQIHTLTMSRQSKHKEAAWAFMRFMAGHEGSSVLSRDIQWLTTRKSAQDAYKAGHMTTNSTGIRFLEDGLNRTTADPRGRKMSDVLPKIQAEILKIWSGKADVVSGLKQAAKVANAEFQRK